MSSLQRQSSRASQPTLVQADAEKHDDVDSDAYPPLPDGGLEAWLTVAGAWFTFFCTTGLSNAQGVFQTYYSLHQLSYDSQSAIGWIGSINIGMTFLLTLVVGGLLKKLGPKFFLVFGTVVTAFAFMMWSLCTKYWQFIIVQGVLLSIGWSALVLPAIIGCQSYFAKRRSLAIGIAISGSSTGGVIWPIFFDRLLNDSSLGFPWTMRVAGFMQLGLLAISTILTNPRPSPGGHDAVPNMVLLKTPKYILAIGGFFFTYFGMYAPFFFAPQYAIHRGLDVNLAFYLISILNASSLFGRIVPGLVADIYGCFNMLTAAILTSAIIAFCWTAATSTGGIVMFAVAYGFTSGAILSQQTAGLAQLIDGDVATAPIALGLGMAITAGPALAGTPIAGALVDKHGYLALSMFTGAILVVGAALIWASRLAQNKKLFASV